MAESFAKKASGSDRHRLPLLDYFRGMAVLLMIIFHLCYDLDHFGLISVDWLHPFWWAFPRFIVFIFLLCMGIAQSISHSQGLLWSKAIKRFLLIGCLSLLISLISYFIFPERWITFGTLHCIALSGLLILPLLQRPRLSLIIGITLLLPPTLSLFFPLQDSLWVFPPSRPSVDHIPIIPWFGVVCLGLFLGQSSLWKATFTSAPTFHHFSPIFRVVSWMGRQSLPLYLTHQLILFPLCFFLAFIKKWMS